MSSPASASLHDDVRRACELAAKSHLVHLREGFLETGGDPQATGTADRRIRGSVPGAARKHRQAGDDHDVDVAATAERQIGIPASVVREVLSAGSGNSSSIAEPSALLSRYIEAAERVWEYVDTWRARA